MTVTNWPRTRGESRAYEKRWKKAAIVLGKIGYTPLTSRVLANILCDLSEDTEQRKLEVLNTFATIVRG